MPQLTAGRAPGGTSSPMGAEHLSVALVGRRLAHNENLGLGYLRAALAEAGIRSTTHYVNDALELRRAADAIMARPPTVLGLSLADGGSALWPLSLAELLHRRGYRGHITSGGQFATLARSWLLERHRWLDSVVRHAGEVPLVELVRRLGAGLEASGTPGVTTRRGDGPPAPVTDDTPMRIVPIRDELPSLLGYPTCHIAASRGCKGRCFYCSPAALQGQEWSEGKQGGTPLAVLREHGVGGVRRRAHDALCDEMSTLWHERGVRYFYFVDEHVLPYEEAAAIEWLHRLKAGLRARGVGGYGIGAMLRADRLTPAVCEAFRDAGLVRCFVGLELATEAEAHGFGRRAPGEAELEIVATFARLGVATVSNLMLVHPDSSPDTIRAGIDLLDALPGGVFEATRMMVYHGTRLHDRMEAEGRLLGNPFRYGYTYDDPAMERFAEIFTRLRGQAFFSYSLAYRTHDTHLALALAKRISPERLDAPVERRLERTRRHVNHLYAEGYRRGLELALSGGGYEASAGLVSEMKARAEELQEELDLVEESLLRAKNRRFSSFAPVRASAAGVLTFALLGSSGCYLSHEGSARPDAGRVDASMRVDAARLDGGMCTDADREAQMMEAAAVGSRVDACFTGGVSIELPGAPPDAFYDPSVFSSTRWGLCRGDPAMAARVAEAERRVEDAVSAAGLSCAAGFARIDGRSDDDMAAMASAADPCIVDPFGTSVQVVLDASGAVVDVRGGPPEVLDCIRASLAGLSFPCLASFEVCPEFAIAE